MIRTLLSPRLLVLITLAISLAVSRTGFVGVFGTMIGFQQLIILILVFSAVSISISAFSSFDITSKRAFVRDIILDMFSLGLSIAIIAYLLTLQINFRVSGDAIILACVAFGLSVIDFLVSLNGGAGKLLEMDREHFTRDN